MALSRARRRTLTLVATAVLLAVASAGARGDQPEPPAGARWLHSGSATWAADASVRVPTVVAGQARLRDVKGTPALPRSAFANLDIPVTALLAYHAAAAVMEQVDTPCRLSWTLLAAIGRVESDHGRYAGAQLRPDGTSSELLRGVALDGDGRLARVRDTDAGLLDGDQVWDRAVGPLQFLPSTWSVVAVDADGDGVRSPDDLQDAALAAAVFLCSAPHDLDTVRGRRAAVFRFNPSASYVASVLSLDRAYRANEFDLPGALAWTAPDGAMPVARPAGLSDAPGRIARIEVPDGDHEVAAAEPAPDPTDDQPPASAGAPEPVPADPFDPTDHGDPGPPVPADPTDSPEPTGPTEPPETETSPGAAEPQEPPATPEPDPAPVLLTGVLAACGTGPVPWCLGEQPLDLGGVEFLGAAASTDFDGDGVVESRAAELDGLAGGQVTVLATPDTAPAFVVAINELAYDGR